MLLVSLRHLKRNPSAVSINADRNSKKTQGFIIDIHKKLLLQVSISTHQILAFHSEILQGNSSHTQIYNLVLDVIHHAGQLISGITFNDATCNFPAPTIQPCENSHQLVQFPSKVSNLSYSTKKCRDCFLVLWLLLKLLVLDLQYFVT